jgi:hypothetical protein
LPVVKPYLPDAVHYLGDVVAHEGATYQALRDTGRAPPHQDWICLARAGCDGADGRSVKIRGTYDPIKAYKAFDVVAYNKGSWVAKYDNPGPCPGDGWQLLASQGRTGEKGVKGDRGEPGPEGAPGPSIVEWKTDPASYTATPIMADGSLGAPLHLRELFAQYHDERGE